MIKILFLIFIIIFLQSCQSAKDALTLKKKNNSDEFLVEKKSPLVLPPDYGKLPVPKKLNNQSNEEKIVEEDIESSFGKKTIFNNQTIKNSKPSSLEKSVLKKIK